MNKLLLPTGAALLLALLVTGCETDGGLATRTQEKSAAYAALKPWEKGFIDKGTIATGFTPDMVYLAMGHPAKTEPTTAPGGGPAELWTYSNFYPSVDAVHGFRHAGYSSESAYQPQRPLLEKTSVNGATVPMGMGKSSQSIAVTGGPQGGNMEPADLVSYTVMIWFENGKVARIAANPNG